MFYIISGVILSHSLHWALRHSHWEGNTVAYCWWHILPWLLFSPGRTFLSPYQCILPLTQTIYIEILTVIQPLRHLEREISIAPSYNIYRGQVREKQPELWMYLQNLCVLYNWSQWWLGKFACLLEEGPEWPCKEKTDAPSLRPHTSAGWATTIIFQEETIKKST